MKIIFIIATTLVIGYVFLCAITAGSIKGN
jgi:hypothetical protein